VKIIEGTIKEEQYIYDDKLMKLIPTGSEILTNGETSFIDDAQLFHSLENLNDTRAMSLHMYMKPIQKCKVYNEQKGRLVELSLSYDSYAGVLIA
jgi:cysteine dioxygenase